MTTAMKAATLMEQLPEGPWEWNRTARIKLITKWSPGHYVMVTQIDDQDNTRLAFCATRDRMQPRLAVPPIWDGEIDHPLAKLIQMLPELVGELSRLESELSKLKEDA